MENSKLADLVRNARIASGWTERDAIRAYRFRSLEKGLRRLRVLENTGEATPELLEKVIVALDLDREAVAAAIRADYADELRAWNEWADQPITPYVVVRFVPGFYGTEALPPDATTLEAAEQHAASVARRWRCRTCLVWSRRLSVWLDAKGGLEHRSEAKPFIGNAPTLHLAGVGPVQFRAKA